MGVTLIQFALVPPAVMLAATLALVNFQNIFRFLTVQLIDYLPTLNLQVLRPYVRSLRLVLEQVLGKATAIKFTLAHVLMMAVVIMLLAVYNAIQKNNELQEKQLQLMQQQKKAKRD